MRFDTSVFRNIKTPQDFAREAKEFEFRKRQQEMQSQLGDLKIQQAQKALNTPDKLGVEELLTKMNLQGGFENLSPMEQAQLKAYDTIQMSKQAQDPISGMLYPKNTSILGMPPRQAMNMPVSQNVPAMPTQGIDPMLANEQAAAMQAQSMEQQDLPNTTMQAPDLEPDLSGLYMPGQQDVLAEAAKLNLRNQADLAKEGRKQEELAEQNQKAFEAFNIAMSNLSAQMANTVTNPLTGSLPALTPGQQGAEGAVSVMAPILKQLFRASGEGVFTDKDQEILMGMLPTRNDYPEVREQKLNTVRQIVATKLGTELPQVDYKTKYGLE